MKTVGRTIIAALFGCLMAPVCAQAEQVWIAGDYSFSDELGGFEILGVSGTGSAGDPIVVEQRLTETGPAVLVIRAAFAPEGWVDFRYSPFLQISIVAVITNARHQAGAGIYLYALVPGQRC